MDGEDIDGAANLKVRRKKMVKLRRIESDVDSADEAEVEPGRRKRKSEATPLGESPSKKVKTATSTAKSPESSAPLHDSQTSQSLTCPVCLEEFSAEPNSRLLALYSDLDALTEEVGISGPGVEFLEVQLCAAVKQEKKKEDFYALGRTQKWPTHIDYTDLVDRISRFHRHLTTIINNGQMLQKLDVWNNFLTDIDNQIFKFSAAKSKLSFTHALLSSRCGYYGPKGQFIITSTIIRLLSEDQDTLAAALYGTIDSLITSNYDRFDEYDADSEGMQLQHFITFILVPFTATLLIAEDLKVSLTQAGNIRDDSNEYGDLMQFDNGDDNILDGLHQTNFGFEGNAEDEKPKPKAKSKAAESKIAPTKQDKSKADAKGVSFTLDDFEEPDPLAKQAKKDKSKKRKTPKKSEEQNASKPPKKSGPKLNPVVSDYSTRSRAKPSEKNGK
ncbi:hypothetical protein C8R45DRAFT_1072689 [Mycena sanguinolenta]|nr:hypothetical protein C8R45DRAFT_1072689 [Mycena sanguinolenta]